MKSLQQLADLSGRSMVITGGLGHLGHTFAITLCELGATVVLVDREPLPTRQQLEFIKSTKSEYIHCDLELATSRNDLINKIKKLNKNICGLVNCAAFVGTSELVGWSTEFTNQSLETWNRAMEVNSTAPFHLCQGLVPILKNSTNPVIINIASTYGLWGPDWRLYDDTSMGNPAAYSVSKGGIIQLTRYLATTLSPEIRVNAIAPGGILRGQPNNFVERYRNKTPLGRMATEEDFKGIIAYLCSDLSLYVTGQTISVDGGWGVW